MITTWRPDRARRILKEEGRNHIWLSKQIGSSVAYISHLFGGVRNPSLSKLKLMAIALETSEGYLLGTSEERWARDVRMAR
jgi:transcriptional regulator with XRE-family HTH domain